MGATFDETLKQAKSATKYDIDDFVKRTYFDKKLKSINKKVTSNKTKRLETEKKQNDLSEKFKLLSTKGLGFFVG